MWVQRALEVARESPSYSSESKFYLQYFRCFIRASGLGILFVNRKVDTLLIIYDSVTTLLKINVR